MIAQQKFPKDFLWGASTASHQVEGGTVNQWSQWELEHAKDLAATAEARLGGLPDWKHIKAEAEDPDNYVSDTGVDHYNRYEEDFDLVKKLQFNSFRFGVEWSRIQPKEGTFNAEAIDHYHRYIDSLLERGIEPVLNIWHWTMPTWFTDKGGFEKKENIADFEKFVNRVAQEYSDKVKYFITINEPNVYASFSYLNGDWPPQIKKPLLAFKVYKHLALAHRKAYAIIKSRRSTTMVGVAAQLANIQSKRPHNVFDNITTKLMRFGWNWWFLNRIRKQQDFIGINYYFTDYYKGFGRKDNPKVPTSDLGWYMEPEGIYPLLLRTWARYKKPIIITENGVADGDDAYREWWLEQTIIAMQRALSEGVDLRGYLHWSLLDNFEWKYGWWPRFGLVAVDRQDDMRRRPRSSAVWFARYLIELRNGDAVRPQSARASSGQPPRPQQPHRPAQPVQAPLASRVPGSQQAAIHHPQPQPRPAGHPGARLPVQQAPASHSQGAEGAARRIRPRKMT